MWIRCEEGGGKSEDDGGQVEAARKHSGLPTDHLQSWTSVILLAFVTKIAFTALSNEIAAACQYQMTPFLLLRRVLHRGGRTKGEHLGVKGYQSKAYQVTDSGRGQTKELHGTVGGHNDQTGHDGARGDPSVQEVILTSPQASTVTATGNLMECCEQY
ncbi:hypothetical protein JRO89_XS12G0068700 [Xanthoceras sorbifolium]|uniref:Uncharacterized protein n=1 Tax=Xanthoceras sorbifolium TaxID=99658 RepID=A0ABQ8HBL0_9ROSI|nr:hypothetical protein JRO89_XS12G0068700 [Xanthoceras sorbifolium]